MDPQKQLADVVRKRKAEEADAEKRNQESSRKRLLRILQKKLTTSFIGSLSKFETFFGSLWGHGKDEEELTDNEFAWRERWLECRTEVLNNGNAQLRALEAEVQMYDMVWQRYKVILTPIQEGGNERE